MAARIRLGKKGRRAGVLLGTTACVAGLAFAPPAQTFGGSCNGHLSTVGFDASHERGPVTIDASAQPAGVVIIGSRGNDTIIGSDFDDFICGGGGNDVIQTGKSTHGDAAWGEWGNDTIVGGDGDDLLDGGPGNDFIVGNAGEDRLFGGPGDDHINSNDGSEPDKVKGGSGYNFCEVDSADDPEGCHFH